MTTDEKLLFEIEKSMMPSTGCTEPVAIALNTATARKEVKGTIQKVILTLNPYLYKNAMGVGIPGCHERGVAMCAAIGIEGGNAELQLNVLTHVTEKQVEHAKETSKAIEVHVLEEGKKLFIQTEIYTEIDAVRVITYGQHTNIVSVEHAPFSPYLYHDELENAPMIQNYDLAEFIDFADNIPLTQLGILKQGLEMNRQIAIEGEKRGIGKGMTEMLARGWLKHTPSTCAKRLAASASYARMSGIPLPVMTATGSGNQGITLFLTVDGVAKELRIDEEKEMRALALGALVNVLCKSYIGELSAVCACGVASGLGASLAICYMLGGSQFQMIGAARNVLGSVCGMICDGAKEGCAYKVELAAGTAVDAALLSMVQQTIGGQDGILNGEEITSLKNLFENLSHLVNVGMNKTNAAIVNIMTRSIGNENIA